ncbi:MAG: hypothetical protein WDA74_09125 [Spirochaetota bacterium]
MFCNNRLINKILLLVCVITLIMCSVYCRENESKRTTLPKFEELKEMGTYVVRYSNVILTIDDKKIKVPIFGGIYEDVFIEELKKMQSIKPANENYPLAYLSIPTEKEKVRNTFLSLLSFYKKNLFKDIDINKPTVIGKEETLWIIWYDFIYENIPSSMMVALDVDDKLIKNNKNKYSELTIESIEINENSSSIILQIFIGESSPFKE